MQRIFDFFSWFFEINCKTTLKETEKMNFLRLFKESVLKTSYVIKKNTSKTLVTKSTLPTWPEWSEWNDSTIGAENFETETYQMFNLKNKLVLDKDILLKESFCFENQGTSIDLFENIHLLFVLDISLSQASDIFKDFTSKIGFYFDFLAGKKISSCFLYECSDSNKLIHFCDNLVAKKLNLGPVQKHISSITTVSLKEFVSFDRKNVVTGYSGNIRLGLTPWTSIFKQFRSHLQKPFITPSRSFATSTSSDYNKETPSIHPKPNPKNTDLSSHSHNLNSLSSAHVETNASVEERIKAKMESLGSSGKPPNILVYTGSDEEHPSRFTNVVHLMQQCLSRDHYALYHLKRSQVTTTPWIENAVMLVVAADRVPKQGIAECFLAYFINGGFLLTLASNFDEFFLNKSPHNEDQTFPRVITFDYEDFKAVSILGSGGSYDNITPSADKNLSITALARDSFSNMPLVVQVHHAVDKGTALLSRLSFDRDSSDTTLNSQAFVSLKQSNPARFSIFKDLLSSLSLNCSVSPPPPLTPLLLFSAHNDKMMNFLEIIKTRMEDNVYKNKGVAYKFLKSNEITSNKVDISPSLCPVVTDAENFPCDFDLQAYKKHLDTKVLGNVAFYADVTTTTMTVMDNYMYLMPPDLGLVVIASTQTAGQGRGGNVWLSPKGCGLFSLHVRFPLSSPLGHHLSCVQHLVALAVVLSVRHKPGYEDINLRIKWPNDVYFGEGLKLGGVLVRSTILQDTLHINLGCGLNISNKDPTLCLNDLITQYNNNLNKNINNNDNHFNIDHPSNIPFKKPLPLFTVEEFVARLINQIERLIINFQADDGESFFELYYQYWLHRNQVVTLNSVDGPRGVIVGVSKYGFLSVRLEDGSLVEVHPDGNSFDMMKNLIAPKIRR